MKLEDPRTIRLLWIVSLVVLALLVAADGLVEHHPHFGIDGSFGFHAWYGFAVCAAMVLVSKFVVGLLLKRRDTYYDD
ncbi:MAG: hypothetical protein H0T76_27495 [Nannocystis sp.]|nr:hypothetical protein [Nannocystis sp.]MBA3550237.1 hypothetical protein [Nannocystis sp.]